MRRVSVLASFVVLAVSGVAGCSDQQGDAVSDGVEASVSTESLGPKVALTSPLNQWQWFNIPGSECGNGTQTGVAVSKGSGSDIVVWMQGGGMCFDELSCKFRIGDYSLVINYKDFGQTQWNTAQGWLNTYGILNRSEATNPYKNSTFIFVPYCTGDFHSGNTTQTWSDGFTMRYSGRKNLTNAISEIVGSFPNPSRVTVYGESAGAFGATLNFFRFKNAYPSKRVDLIADSGPYLQGAAPVAAGTPVWGLASAWPAGCTTCASDYRNIYTYNATTYPTSKFAYLNYDQDLIVMGGALLLPWIFYGRLKSLQQSYIAPTANSRFFAPGGWKHGVARESVRVTANGKALGTWLSEMISGSSTWASHASWGTICSGATVAVSGELGTKFNELGGCEGVLGKPIKGRTSFTENTSYGYVRGYYADFQNGASTGSIYVSNDSGAQPFEIHGPIRDYWLAQGGVASSLGLPTADQEGTASSGGMKGRFQNGAAVYYSVETGAHSLTHAQIRSKYDSLGADSSSLGLPTTEPYTVNNFDKRQDFQGGHIYWSMWEGAKAFVN